METNKTTQIKENMFTKKSKIKLFQIVFVAHDSICDYFFFNRKHNSLIYKVVKEYYEQSQNYGTLFGTIMFLFCLTCAKIRHNMKIFSHVENSQKRNWKVDIFLRRKIIKRGMPRCSIQLYSVDAHSGTRVSKITKCVPITNYI